MLNLSFYINERNHYLALRPKNKLADEKDISSDDEIFF